MLNRRRRTRVAVRPVACTVVRPEAAQSALPPLPLACFLDVLSRLPPGERLLSSAVSRAWRAAAREPSLWASVDLTQDGAMLAAVRRNALGKIANLGLGTDVDAYTVIGTIKTNARALRSLSLRGVPWCVSAAHVIAERDDSPALKKEVIDRALRSARGLERLDADVLQRS